MPSAYDPLLNLPAGRVLTRPQYDTLKVLADGFGRNLTLSEIEDVVGTALAVPSIRRDFLTGDYPHHTGRNIIE